MPKRESGSSLGTVPTGAVSVMPRKKVTSRRRVTKFKSKKRSSK